MTDRKLATRIIHAGEQMIGGAAVPPIHQTTVFEQTEPDPSYDSIRYPRLNNTPNHHILGDKLADLEGAEAGIATASGMAAITTTLLALLRDGGHALVQDCLYGGTHAFAHHELAAFGMSCDVLADDPADWAAQVRPETRLIYVEALTNPRLDVIDHSRVVEFAREHDLVSVIDNTFATPVNFPAVRFGYDIAVHSATKYLNGHSDLCAGAVTGSTELLERVKQLLNLLGGSLDPMGCYLLHRGTRTLHLRMRQHNANASALAEFLAQQPAVQEVCYPTLPTHPAHERARELFAGCGGVLAFELVGGEHAANRFIDAVELPIHAPSLGGPETLITRPCKTSHAGMSPEERAAAGITDGLIRVAVGVEDAADLCADFGQALERSAG